MSSCPVCLETELKQPAACIPCGHTFCYSCITQWLQRSHDPLSSQSHCPQCRRPVREVQKLFISDWPVLTSKEQEAGGWSGAWVHFQQGVSCIADHMRATFYTLVSYLTAFSRYVQAIQNRYQINVNGIKHHAAQCIRWTLREWNDLGRNAQCFVAVTVLLILLLLVQDAVHEDGFHRGILLPVILLLFDALSHLTVAAVYILVRPFLCLFSCGLEIVVALTDIIYTLLIAVVMVAFNLVCIPWLLLGVCFRLVWAVLCRVWAVTGLAVSVGILALPFILGNEEWKNMLQVCFSAVLVRIQVAANKLMRHMQQLEEWLDRERAREGEQHREPRQSQSYPFRLHVSVSRGAREQAEEENMPAEESRVNTELYRLTTLLEPFAATVAAHSNEIRQ